MGSRYGTLLSSSTWCLIVAPAVLESSSLLNDLRSKPPSSLPKSGDSAIQPTTPSFSGVFISRISNGFNAFKLLVIVCTESVSIVIPSESEKEGVRIRCLVSSSFVAARIVKFSESHNLSLWPFLSEVFVFEFYMLTTKSSSRIRILATSLSVFSSETVQFWLVLKWKLVESSTYL